MANFEVFLNSIMLRINLLFLKSDMYSYFVVSAKTGAQLDSKASWIGGHLSTRHLATYDVFFHPMRSQHTEFTYTLVALYGV